MQALLVFSPNFVPQGDTKNGSPVSSPPAPILISDNLPSRCSDLYLPSPLAVNYDKKTVKDGKRPIKSSHPCNEFAPTCVVHPLSNFVSSYSGKNNVVNYLYPQTTPPPRSAVLLTPRRSYRAREKHAPPCDTPLSLYRCADSRWSGRRVWTWLFAPSAAPKDRRRYATFRRVVNR